MPDPQRQHLLVGLQTLIWPVVPTREDPFLGNARGMISKSSTEAEYCAMS